MDSLASSINRIMQTEGCDIIGTSQFWGRLLDENAFKDCTSGEKHIFKTLNEHKQVISLVLRGVRGERLTESEIRNTVFTLAEKTGFDRKLVLRILLSYLMGTGAVYPQFSLEESDLREEGLQSSPQSSVVSSDRTDAQLKSQSSAKAQENTDTIIGVVIIGILASIAVFLCVKFWSVARYVLGGGTLVFLIYCFHEALGNMLKSFWNFLVDLPWKKILRFAILGLLLFLLISHWKIALAIVAILVIVIVVIFK